MLLAVYVLVTTATQAYAGIGSTGIGLGNPNNADDVFSVLGAPCSAAARWAASPCTC